jgi:hypothetical protein
MEIEKDRTFSLENTAFSDQYFEDSFKRVIEFVSSNKDFNIYDLDKNIDPVLLKGLGDMLEKSAEININADISDDELDKLNDKIFEDIKNWELPKREVLNVTLVSKILNNMEYTFKNMNPTLLKEELYKRNYTYDLLWVWFALNRQKQRGIKRDI